MNLKPGVALACALAATSCVLTIDDVVPPADTVFDPALLGVWVGRWEGESDSARAVISGIDERTYHIDYTAEDGERTGAFQARLGRLGGRTVLEVWPAGDAGETPVQDDLAVPGHMLFFLDTIADAMRVSALDPDSVALALEQGTLRLPSRTVGERTVLLGETDALRTALGPLVTRGELIARAGTWRRAADTVAGGVDAPAGVPCFEAAAWRDADLLFHRDPHWVGADVASTVDLGDGRILWLFGDTWIDPTGTGTRRGARMVSNSVAIQTGTDPSRAGIRFYWGTTDDGRPDAMFPDQGAESLWFGNGVRVEERLVLFLARTLRGTGTGLGFEHVGWTAVMVENPDDEPSTWRVRTLETPANPLGILVGFAAVLRLGEYVYALGSENPVKSHPIYAVRWPAEAVRRGNLGQPEWWAGERIGWIPDSSNAQRWPLFENGQSELTIHRDRTSGRFLAVHTQGFGPADVMLRTAPALTGPWTAPRMLYRPPEYYRPDIMIYAGKAHPELTGADLVLTYATNSFAFGRMVSDSLVYYPRFIRLTRCR